MDEQKAPIVGDRNTVELYFDNVGQIHYINGNIKLDMLTIDPSAPQQPAGFIGTRIVMSLQSFLNSFEAAKNMIDKLVANGVLSQTSNK